MFRLFPKPSILPDPFEWCHIRAGDVGIGYSPTKTKTYSVTKDFFMAKYLLTIAQFKLFMDEIGHENIRLFKLNANKNPNCPVEMIHWDEAIFFTEWLSEKVGFNITLPTETQWQRAAQGDDGRLYPWGNDYDPSKCNVEDSAIGESTPVESYPQGASPYGVYDMIGNVFEWCLTDNNTGENSTEIPPQTEHLKVTKVFRGSSYSTSKVSSTTYSRGATPIFFQYLTGIRLVLNSV